MFNFRKVLSVGLFFLIVTPINAFEYLQPLPDQPIFPKNNPQTAQKIALGKQLFFDKRLSLNGDVNCNSCHNLAAGGDDDGAVFHMRNRNIKRSAPSLWNVAHLSTYFWDARAKSLEAQAEEHLFDPNIMNMANADLLNSRLTAIPGYRTAFKQAFTDQQISVKNVTHALAAFQRTLVAPDSRFDQYIKGKKSALNEKEKRGLALFKDKGCLSCHFGRNFAGPAPGPALKMGDAFYELMPTIRGSIYEDKYNFLDDLGLFHVTLDPEHKLMWKVPSLRNVADTAPYFHNGVVNDLHEAVRVMDRVQFNYGTSEEEVDDIVAFLKTLTGVYPAITLPRLPETEGSSLITH